MAWKAPLARPSQALLGQKLFPDALKVVTQETCASEALRNPVITQALLGVFKKI